MMTWLGLILFAPWFLIVAWWYWAFPRDLPRTLPRRLFDLVSIVAAFAASAAGLYWFFIENTNSGDAIWQQVIATLGAYLGFLLVLLFAFAVRSRIWRRLNR